MTILRTASGRVVQRRGERQQQDDDYPQHFRSSLQYSPTLSAAPSPTLDKPLTLSASAWKPAAKITASSSSSAPSDAVDVPSDPAALSKRIQSTLNKLTPTNYEKLSHQLLRLLSSVSSSSQLLSLTSLIFDKALQDIFYGHMYARLCKQLSDGGVGLAAVSDEAGGAAGGVGKGFRWYLLNKCQEEFERGGKELRRAEAERKELDDKKEEKKEEKEESKEDAQADAEQGQEEQRSADGPSSAEQRKAASKRRMISSLRFIGELFMVELVTTNIMIACCQQLLSVIELQRGEASDDGIQGLLRLLLTVGRKLDVKENEQRLRRLWEVVQRESEQEDKHSSRGRFALLDLLEARRSGWREREGQKGQTASDEVLHKPQPAAGAGGGSGVMTRIGFSGEAHDEGRGRQRDRERDPQERERERERERELIPHLTAGVRLEQANAMAATVSRWQPGAKKKAAAPSSSGPVT